MISVRTMLYLTGLLLHAGILSSTALGAEGQVNCSIQQGPCTSDTAQGMHIVLDIQPRPVKAMSDLRLSVSVSRNGKPVTDAAVSLSLSMPGMYMGRNEPALVHVRDGRYKGTGVITRCMSGKKIWKAGISVKQSEVVEQVNFVFEVQ